jgi:hypothetical protein
MSEEKIPFDWEVYSKDPSQWRVIRKSGEVLYVPVTLKTGEYENPLLLTYPLTCDGTSYTLAGRYFEDQGSSKDLVMTRIAEPTPELVKELPDLGYVNIYYQKVPKLLGTGITYDTLQEATSRSRSTDTCIHLTTIRVQDIPEVREILKTINLD